jgi:hypothetical protein
MSIIVCVRNWDSIEKQALGEIMEQKYKPLVINGPPLWSSGQSSWLLTQRSPVRFPSLPDFLSSSGSGTGSTQHREDK